MAKTTREGTSTVLTRSEEGYSIQPSNEVIIKCRQNLETPTFNPVVKYKTFVVTSLSYRGDADNGIVSDVARNWTEEGRIRGFRLFVSLMDCRSISGYTNDAARFGFCSCTSAYWVAGHYDFAYGNIVLNKGCSRRIIAGALTPELGHYFFGEGHPKARGDLGSGGIMDYESRRLNRDDRRRYKET